MQPVLDKANEYLNHGECYAFGQILLLAGICVLRRADVSNPIARRMIQAVIDKAAALVRERQSSSKQPVICSEFVYRCYDEAVPGKDDPYTLDIQEFQTADARPRLLGRRRRNQSTAEAPTIPLESLLGILQAEHGSLTAAIDSPKVLMAAPSAVVSDEELDSLIGAYLAESSGDLPKATTRMLEAGPEVTMDDLRRSVAGFAAALHETTNGGAKLGAGVFGTLPVQSAATPAKTLEDFSADFVTPGDLFRSRSLTTIGKL